MHVSLQKTVEFRKKIYQQYQNHPRKFPWRNISDPYAILVSEFMLQQTQTSRVVAKYDRFMKRFPTVKTLAHAPLSEVLRLWHGLGYNRRAKYLHESAKIIQSTYNSVIPSETELLDALPGIGPYTAAAIAAFAYDKPTVFLETNIRSVFIHEFYSGSQKVSDKDLYPLIKRTLDRKDPRNWYYALMDYGAMLKKEFPNPGKKSTSYAKQSRFAGSNRQKRGAVIRALLDGPQEVSKVRSDLKLRKPILATIIRQLEKEGMIVQDGETISLAA